MKWLAPSILLAGLALASCGQQSEEYAASAPVTSKNIVMEERLEQPARFDAKSADAAGSASPSEIPVGMPKIAYVYDYGYRVAASDMAALQRHHADLCERQGPQVCRILNMQQSGGEGDYAYGSLALEVAAPKARAFGADLAKAASAAGGEEVSSAISGEDLSKQIVDTEARLRARTLLRDRLMEVLRSRKGTVAELVEAERGVAQVNEEIDQARSWLAEMKGRVAFSRVNLSYQSGSRSTGGFLAPIRAVVGNLGSIFGTVIAGLIGLFAVMVPLGLVGWGLWRGWRKVRPRREAEGASES